MSCLTEKSGNLFKAPSNSVLVHACNCQGKWGQGIARNFKEKYPAAFTTYRAHCTNYELEPSELRGTCLLIPPNVVDQISSKRHWIACLFTSTDYGEMRDPPEVILEATRDALTDLKSQLRVLSDEVNEDRKPVGHVYGCRFNSGYFAVPWERTKEVIEAVGLEMTITVHVLTQAA
ncbi:MAG: ADP-ribose 1''-phosphate phosphatase [Caeruleum heppii]|nr:MAG: ADP-ribose 1''-phosphate phosphatase [Caeruleum heppii]